ncbi:putative T7SS-secreted protein [Streptomyces longisporoflavus]|uniref:T7SS-secreted protein n=1 Tax=Streptomyces longisporoflavus TaxID=28044 RepID=A0ABW7QR01_9ACTN
MTASSKPRPRDWSPLAESDPVPGDPEEIRAEVKHMKGVAESLRDQARLLRGIGDDNELKGKFAGKLREESGVLEKHLREVAGRYERVHGHLTNWANDLEEFQTQADKVRTDARQKQDDLAAEKKKQETEDKHGKGADSKQPTPSESGAEDDPLREFRDRLDRIKGDRDDRASHHAGLIRDQLDDVIEDSWWDDTKGWIHENVEAIKLVLDVLGWVATIAGILALFIPGLNVLVVVLSFVVVAARLVMYAAGEASLAEVLVDCIGLATMGVGVRMLSKLKFADQVIKNASKTQRLGRLKSAVRANKAAREEITRVIATTSDDGLRTFARQSLNRLRREMLDNAGRVTDEVPVGVNRLERLGLGDDAARATVENIRRNADTFPESAAQIAGKSETYYKVAVGATAVGTVADYTDKALGESPTLPDKPFFAPYEDGKGELWKLPQDTHW